MGKNNNKLISELNSIIGFGKTRRPTEQGPFGIVDIKKHIQSLGDLYPGVRTFAKTRFQTFNSRYTLPLESLLAIDRIIEDKLIVVSTVPNFNIKEGEIFTPDLKQTKLVVNLISSYRANEIIPISPSDGDYKIDLILPLSVLVYKIADTSGFSDLTVGGLFVKTILNQLDTINIRFDGIDYLHLSQSDYFVGKVRELINSHRNIPELINPFEIQKLLPNFLPHL